MIDAVVAGHLCVDVIPQIPPIADPSNFLAPGRLTETGGMVLSTGGSVSNTGLALHKWAWMCAGAPPGPRSYRSLTREILRSHGERLIDALTVGYANPAHTRLSSIRRGLIAPFLHCPAKPHFWPRRYQG